MSWSKGSLVRSLAAFAALSLVLAACAGAATLEDPSQPGAESGESAAELTDDTLVPEINVVGPSSAWELQQFEANSLTLEYWEELGIRTSYEAAPDFAGFSALVGEADWHAASAGYLGTPFRIDPDELLSRPLMCGQSGNYGEYCNDQYDEIVRASQQAFDLDERRSLVFQAQELQALDLPMVTSYHPADAYAWNHEAYDNVVHAVGQGLDNFWNAVYAEPLVDDEIYRVGIQGTFRSINPMAADSYSMDVDVHNLVWDTLARVGPSGDIVEWAATSWDFTEGDTLEVSIRDDMEFHDGRPVTTEDVAFSFEYFRDWEVGLYAHVLSTLESATAIDESTVSFAFTEPTATFISSALTMIPILPRADWENIVDDEGLDHPREWTETNLIGSGPYIISAVSATEGIELDANTDHFESPNSVGYQMRLYAEDQGIFRAMQAGDVYFHYAGRLGAPALEAAEEEDHLSVASSPGITVRWMAFSFKDGSPFRDFPFREAIAHTFDYETIVEAIVRGWGDPGTGTIGPGNEFWNNSDITFGDSDGPHWREFDLERARSILADAGYRWDDQGRLHYPEDYDPQVHYDG